MVSPTPDSRLAQETPQALARCRGGRHRLPRSSIEEALCHRRSKGTFTAEGSGQVKARRALRRIHSRGRRCVRRAVGAWPCACCGRGGGEGGGRRREGLAKVGDCAGRRGGCGDWCARQAYWQQAGRSKRGGIAGSCEVGAAPRSGWHAGAARSDVTEVCCQKRRGKPRVCVVSECVRRGARGVRGVATKLVQVLEWCQSLINWPR